LLAGTELLIEHRQIAPPLVHVACMAGWVRASVTGAVTEASDVFRLETEFFNLFGDTLHRPCKRRGQGYALVAAIDDLTAGGFCVFYLWWKNEAGADETYKYKDSRLAHGVLLLRGLS